MKSIIITTILCLFLVGCGRNEYKPVEIFIKQNGAFFINGQLSNCSHLGEFLISTMAEKGTDLKAIFIADEDTPFSVVVPVVLASAKTHAFLFSFQLSGSSKRERCCSNYVVYSRPQPTEVNVSIIDNIIYVDNSKKSAEEVRALFDTKPEKTGIYRVFISCCGTTTFGEFYKFIELCNKSKYACEPEIQVMDKL